MRNVKDFGAVGDGVVNDAGAIQHAVESGVSHLCFPPGTYRLESTITVDLSTHPRIGLSGAGGTAKIVMAGAGPAFHFLGSHRGSADPGGFAAEVWQNERMPLVENLEIEGAHEEADGVRIERTMQSTFQSVLLRKLRHGIHVVERARNILVSHCHIYDNQGIGIFFDHTNLHQVIIADSHISYNKLSGIKILNGQVRNVQITGNDIEYNYDQAAGEDARPSAEIWIETSGNDATIREGTIGGNTIQSRYAPGGANIRIIGRGGDENHHAGMIAISGNLIGSQETNVKLESCRGITITGNVIYSGHKHNLHAVDCRNIVVNGNSFDHNPDYLPKELATGVRFENCSDCNMSACTIQDAHAGEHTVKTPAALEREALVEAHGCKRFTLAGCQVIDAGAYGVLFDGCSMVNMNGCTVVDQREEKKMRAAVKWRGCAAPNLMAGNILGEGSEGVVLEGESEVTKAGNG
jgi:hypothetical protein